MEFLTDADYPGRDNPEGIPAVSLVYHDGEDVIHLQHIMLPEVNREIRERKLTEKDTLYRVDYFLGGRPRRTMGILKAGSGNADFPEWLGCKAADGKAAEAQLLCGLLKKHLALCSLEQLAGEEIFRQEQGGGEAGTGDRGEDRLYQQVNTAYYRTVLVYVEKSRRILNEQLCPVLPPFPERGPFMAEWYRKQRERGGRHED